MDNSTLEHLVTESRNPRAQGLDTLSPEELAGLMCEEEATVAQAVAKERGAIASAIGAVAERLSRGGCLFYLGAGTSGRLGVLDASELPPTFGFETSRARGLIAGGEKALVRSSEGAEDVVGAAGRDLESVGLNEADVLIGIAASGRTPYVVEGLEEARRRGARTIGVSFNPGSPVSEVAEIAITPIVGPEILSGSTRLKAGTATKMVLNAISTGAMVRMGRVYGNLMVDVRATNQKLQLRALRIVRILTGLEDEGEGRVLLERCDWEVKTAIVVRVRSVPPDEARALLETARGHLREVVGDLDG